MTAWEVPGYDVLELLGFGTTGEVWRARERASGTVVALRRLAGGDRAAVAAVRREATVVRSLPSPHLVRLRTTVRAGGDDVLVLDHAAGGSLAALLARRGRLDPGEVVTVLAPVADALGQAHQHGLVHGRLGVSSVLLTAQGMPLLDGLGAASLTDAGAADPAADVAALGALGALLLTGTGFDAEPLAAQAPTAPLPLLRALEAARAGGSSAADLAAMLLAACPALPLRGVQVADVPPPPTREPVRHRPPRPLLAGAAAALGLLVVVAAGWSWGAQDRPRAAVAPALDWAAVLQRLDAGRASAFAHADPARLTLVYATGSPALAADRDRLTALQRGHRTAVGVRHVTSAVTAVQASADRAELRVTEALGAYRLLDARGRVVSQRPAGPVATRLVVLVRGPAGWRVQQLRPPVIHGTGAPQ